MKPISAIAIAIAIATAIASATASPPQALILKALKELRAGKYKWFCSENWPKQRVKQIWILGDGSRPNILSTFLATPGQFNRWSGKSNECDFDVPVTFIGELI